MKTMWAWAGGLIIPLLLLGCGGSEAVTVKGKITYKGNDLNMGSVTFYDSGGKGKSFEIRKEGAFLAEGLKPGTYKVTVTTPKVPPVKVPAPEGGKKIVEKGLMPVVVDDKYGKVETSGLEYEIRSGSQELNIALPKS